MAGKSVVGVALIIRMRKTGTRALFAVKIKFSRCFEMMLCFSSTQRGSKANKKSQVKFINDGEGSTTMPRYDVDEKVTTHSWSQCKSGQIKIRNSEDLVKYLEICSGEEPLVEGYLCKDISYPSFFDRFRRRYFVLHDGLLLYYKHKSHYNKDKSNGLVSRYSMVARLMVARPCSSR